MPKGTTSQGLPKTGASKRIHQLYCYRCAWEWWPRKTTGTPQCCPKCHSPYWASPPVYRRKPKEQDNGNT